MQATSLGQVLFLEQPKRRRHLAVAEVVRWGATASARPSERFWVVSWHCACPPELARQYLRPIRDISDHALVVGALSHDPDLVGGRPGWRRNELDSVAGRRGLHALWSA